jgi:hypothetical protein
MTNWRPSYDWRNPGGSLSWLLGREYGMVEERGGIVQTDKGPRVELRRPDGSTALGHLSGTKDADLNPGAVLADHQAAKERRDLNELRDESRSQRNFSNSILSGQLANQGAQIKSSTDIAIATLTQQGQDAQRRFELQMQGLRDAQKNATDANSLNRYSLELSSLGQREATRVKEKEIDANIALQQGDLALRKEQLADLRGSRKLAFIGQAVSALLA